MAVLGALVLARRWLGLNAEEAVTISFLTLAYAQLWHVFNMRERGTPLFYNEITQNRYVWAALGLCTGMILAAVYVPGLAAVLQVTPPDLAGWSLIVGMSLLPLLVGQALLRGAIQQGQFRCSFAFSFGSTNDQDDSRSKKP